MTCDASVPDEHPKLRALGAILIGTSLLTTNACSRPSPVVLGAHEGTYQASDYDRVLRHWTRSLRFHSLREMDNVLTVTATYRSRDFRSAYVSRYVDDYQLGDVEAGQLRSEQVEQSAQWHEFYLTLYGQRPGYAELGQDSAAWQVHLVDAEGRRTSGELSEISSPGAHELSYFPYTSPHRKVYRVLFPVEQGGQPTVSRGADWFGLSFSGPQGNTTLKWEVTDDRRDRSPT